MWSYWSNVDSFPLPASTVNFQVPLSTGSVEFSSIWQVLSSGLLKVILPLSALEGESYRLDNILHMKQLDLIDTMPIARNDSKECEDWSPCNIRIVRICRSGDGQGGVIGARFSEGTIKSAPTDCFI